MQRFTKGVSILAILVGLLTVLAQPSLALNVTWNLPSSGTWDTSTTNWTGGSTVYTDGDNATFNFNNAAGGTISVTGGGVAPGSTAFSNAINTGPGTFTVSGGNITSGNITKSGIGIVTVSSNYTGSGTLSAGAGTLNMNGTATSATGFTSSGGTLNLGFSYSGSTPLTATSGTIGITNGATWTLNANATGSGTISIGAGSTLKLTNNEQLADTLTMSGGGGTFDMSNFNETINNLNAGVNIINMGNLTVKAGFDHGNGNLSGNGMLINDVGANFGLILNGTMTYTGGTWVKSGKFYLYGTADNILPSTGVVTVDSTGVFSLNYHNSAGRTQTIGALNGTGSVKSSNLDTANTIFRVGNGGGTGAFSGVFSGAGSLVKLGGGVQTMSGNNTYSGNTTVSAGTLIFSGTNQYVGTTTISGGAKLVVNGSNGTPSFLQDNYTVNNNATLGGSGTIRLASGKAVNVLSGGKLEPGNSPGTLTIYGGLTLNNGAILNMELGATGDKIIVNGLLTGSVAVGGITLNLTEQVGYLGNYVLLDWTGGSAASLDLSDFTVNFIGSSYGELAIVGNQLLFVLPVPEPSSVGLVGLGLPALVRRRKVRQA